MEALLIIPVACLSLALGWGLAEMRRSRAKSQEMDWQELMEDMEDDTPKKTMRMILSDAAAESISLYPNDPAKRARHVISASVFLPIPYNDNGTTYIGIFDPVKKKYWGKSGWYNDLYYGVRGEEFAMMMCEVALAAR